MPKQRSFFTELKQRHVVRAAIIYAAAVWALAQGISQLSPAFDLATGVTFWFVIACVIGFPFWIAFAWFFKFTSSGIVREDETVEDPAAVHRTGRILDYWIIGIMAVAIVLLLTNELVLQRGKTIREFTVAPTATAKTAVKTDVAVTGSTDALFAAQPIPAKSIAVLPFTSENGKHDQQYFSDGLSEDLITALSQFGGLKVINRDSSFRFRNSQDSVRVIGEKLGVAHLLEGSVQKLGDEVRISAELVNVSDGSTQWSQHYDRPYKDLFALEDDITKSVTTALKAKLLPTQGAVVLSDRPPSGNLAAYNDFLQGGFYTRHGGEAGLRKAIDYLSAAVRLDPEYALAWAALSAANAGLAGNYLGGNQAAQSWDQARAEVQTALSLDPNLWQAHSSYSFILISEDHNWPRAEIEAERAYQLNPDKAFYALARVWAGLGKPQKAVELIQHGLSSDPLCPNCYFYLARLLPGLGRFDEAEQVARKAMQMMPGSGFARLHLVYIQAMRGDAAAALQTAQQQPPGKWRDLGLAFALQVGSHRAAADQALQTVIAKQSGDATYYIAEIYALRRDPNSMFKWLDRANENRDYSVQLLLTDPAILRYKNDPRFAALCKKLGLPTTTDAKALP